MRQKLDFAWLHAAEGNNHKDVASDFSYLVIIAFFLFFTISKILGMDGVFSPCSQLVKVLMMEGRGFDI